MTTLRLDFCSHDAAKHAVMRWHYSRQMPKAKLVKVGVWEDAEDGLDEAASRARERIFRTAHAELRPHNKKDKWDELLDEGRLKKVLTTAPASLPSSIARSDWPAPPLSSVALRAGQTTPLYGGQARPRGQPVPGRGGAPAAAWASQEIGAGGRVSAREGVHSPPPISLPCAAAVWFK